MTKLEFFALCGEFLIDPALALENDDVVNALRNSVGSDDTLVRNILENEY
tara:strand:+ start:159 stop:308 length:150 start_codon:yes stop_codon:yes gene_type:complete